MYVYVCVPLSLTPWIDFCSRHNKNMELIIAPEEPSHAAALAAAPSRNLLCTSHVLLYCQCSMLGKPQLCNISPTEEVWIVSGCFAVAKEEAMSIHGQLFVHINFDFSAMNTQSPLLCDWGCCCVLVSQGAAVSYLFSPPLTEILPNVWHHDYKGEQSFATPK